DALLGGAGDDALFGGVDDDVLGGDDGRDLLAGGAGNDLLAGGPDRDVLMGADGDDLLVAGLVLGLPPDDWQVLRGAQPLTQILRDPRNVTLAQFGSIDRSQANFPTDRAGDVLYGESGADFLIGSAGEDLLDGGAGDDTGLGGDGADRLRGGDGDDHLRGSGGNDVLEGNAGDDFLAGGGTDDDGLEADGADLLYGGAGQDELQGGPGDDRLSGDSGNDRLYAGPGADWLSGGEGDDRLYGDEDADTLFGDAGADRLYGQAGDDQPIGGDDADYLDGGDGSDRLLGEAGNDRLTGGDADDQLFGGPGDDVLQGEAGADWLDGGAGSDTLLGGSGHDHYWVSDTGGLDLIIDVDGDNGLWLPDAHGLAAWRAEAAGPDLLLMRDDAGLRIRDWAHSIDWLRFGDRGMLDGAHLLQPALAGVVETLTAAGPAGTAGDDELTLRLDGGTVSAGAGNDRYVLNAGVRVQIDDARGDNTLVWPTGSSATALALEGTATGWRLSHGDIQVDCAPGTFARYVFGNGTELSAADMLARAARELALAPRVAEAIGNRALAAGETFSFTVSDGAFVDPNPDARLSLDATLSDGRPLPYWLRFDPQTARFSGRAPAGATLSLAVTVRASDETGLSAAQQLGIDVLPPFTPGSSAVFALAS
ncbi:MAG: hypothetical protein KGS47_17110, partial [Chloroflexi bacterium]|nr:hypothetical protein [Chloroflexota bacterium]